MSTRAAQAASPVTTFSPLRHGAFAAIWAASIFSAIGGQVQQVGASWLMTSLDPSPQMVALVTAAGTAPILLFALMAGAMADVIDRRVVLLGAQVLMFAASAVLAAITFMGLVTPFLLLLLTFLVGTGIAIMAPAWQSLVGDLVPREEVPAAVGLNIMAFNIARTLGPAAGGVLVAWLGARANFALNAVSYLALIGVLLAWRTRRGAPTFPAEAVLPAMRDGVLYAFHARQVRRVLVRALAFGFCASIVVSLMALVARVLLGQGAAIFGVLMGCMGAGAVLGATALSSLRRSFGSETLVRAAIVLTSASLAVIGLSRQVPLTCAALLVVGAGMVLGMSTFNISVQLSVPRWVVGRALALYQMFAFGGMTLGAWFWGRLGEEIGIGPVYLVSAGALLATLLLAVPMKLREVHEREVIVAPDANAEADLPEQPPGRGLVVVINYDVPPVRLAEFKAAVSERQRIRLRDGARQVTLLEDAEDPRHWTERFFVRNWTEHRRQLARRTLEAKQLDELLANCHSGAQPPTPRYFLEHRIRPEGEGPAEPFVLN